MRPRQPAERARKRPPFREEAAPDIPARLLLFRRIACKRPFCIARAQPFFILADQRARCAHIAAGEVIERLLQDDFAFVPAWGRQAFLLDFEVMQHADGVAQQPQRIV